MTADSVSLEDIAQKVGTQVQLELSSPALQERVAALYEKSREEIYRNLVLMGIPPACAQEACQEAFLRLYIQLRDGKEIQHVRAWLYAVAHNWSLNQIAREPAGAETPVDWERVLPARGPDPEQTLLDQERFERLHEAMGTLSKQQRACLHLRAEGLRYREIAEVIGISRSAVCEFLRRGISRLRKALYE